jgi:ABC-type transport system involved in multi-copper enzyme maturation permease subunit
MSAIEPLYRATKSELVRLRRRSFIFGWPVLAMVLAAVVVTFIFTAVGDGGDIPAEGPGAQFPGIADLQAADGYLAAFQGAASFLGVVTLTFWAIAAATDYSSGLIRLLVQAAPRRLPLLGGKIVALVLWTIGATTLALAIVALVSVAMAQPSDIDTAAWAGNGLLATAGDVLVVWFNAVLAQLVWGVLGLLIATATRSAAIAIGVGLAYVLIFESILGLVARDAVKWLPGGILSALAGGGTTEVSYGTAIIWGIGYALVGVAASVLIFSRREITD